MLERFVLLKITSEYENVIFDMFRGLCGNRIESQRYNEYIVIYYNYENNDDIINLVKSLEIDLDAKIMCYISYKGNQEELKEELEIAVKLLESKEIGFYNLKSLLLELKDVKNKDQVLDFILKDTGITKEFVLEFANSNMNATKAARILYMHRNTIIYKLDKLLALKDFDLKSFIDMHILYSLSK